MMVHVTKFLPRNYSTLMAFMLLAQSPLLHIPPKYYQEGLREGGILRLLILDMFAAGT